MENTADLAMVKKTIINTLHKESKSQRVITERGGCSQSAVSKHIKCKVDWKENKLGRKRILSSKADSNIWESFTRSELSHWNQCIKSHHSQTSSGKGLPSHFWKLNERKFLFCLTGRYQSNLCFHYTWAVPQADCLHATPHWCCNSCKRRANQVLSA